MNIPALAPDLVFMLWIHQPAMVKLNAQQIEDDALWGVLEVLDPGELHIHVEAGVQLREDGYGVSNVVLEVQHSGGGAGHLGTGQAQQEVA